MREIPLTNSPLFALVSDEDYEALSRYKSWKLDERGYIIRKKHVGREPVTKVKKTTTVQMHREIMGFPEGLLVDHADGNKLRNTRDNLRIATASQNQQNRGKQKNNTTGFKGVTLHKKAGKYMAHIGVDGDSLYLGLFNCPKEAAKAYNAACLEHHKFGQLNVIE